MNLSSCRRLCLVTAVDVEFNAARALLAHPVSREEHGISLCRGVRGGREIALLKTGMGAVGFAPRLEAHLRAEAYDALLVAGLAGALVPGLRAGDAVLYAHCDRQPENVREMEPARDGIARIFPDPLLTASLAARLREAGRTVHEAPGITVGEVLIEASAKQSLGERHAAAAVDMETFSIWRVCRERGLPFAALRTISDEADQDLPDFSRGYDARGRLHLPRMLSVMAARPAVTARFLRTLRAVMRSFRGSLEIVLEKNLV